MAARVTKCRPLYPALLKHYSTPSTATVQTTASPDSEKTLTDPLGLTKESVSRIYSAPNSETKELFPRGLPKNFRLQIECFKNTSWILRSQTYDIISQLRDDDGVEGEQDACGSGNKFLIYGQNGGGKTICLSQVIHWCWKAGWMVLHVPGVSFWAQSRKELRASQLHPGTYDQPHEASTWLKNFRAVNAKALKDIKLSEPRKWTKRESSEVGDSLWEVIDQGLRKPVISTDVVGVVIDEILKDQDRQLSLASGERRKLLLAMDEFNGLYNPCAARVNKFEELQPQQLNLIRYARKLIPMGKFPGAVVLALSRHRTYRFFAPTTSPEGVLGEEGMESVAGYKQVEVGNFSREEVVNFLKYYQDCQWITKEPFERVVEEMWHLTEGNPREITKLSSLL